MAGYPQIHQRPYCDIIDSLRTLEVLFIRLGIKKLLAKCLMIIFNFSDSGVSVSL